MGLEFKIKEYKVNNDINFSMMVEVLKINERSFIESFIISYEENYIVLIHKSTLRNGPWFYLKLRISEKEGVKYLNINIRIDLKTFIFIFIFIPLFLIAIDKEKQINWVSIIYTPIIIFILSSILQIGFIINFVNTIKIIVNLLIKKYN